MKRLDLSGKKVCGATIVEDCGTDGKSRLWKCECQCGNSFFRGAGVINQAIKGNPNYECRMHCDRCGRQPGIAHTPAYQYWSRVKSQLCERWQDFETWRNECYLKRTGRYLCRKDFSRELGPDNFYWSRHMESHNRTIKECAEVLIRKGESPSRAMQRAKSVSRQRRAQIIARTKGLCITCFQPSKTWRCDKCK